MRLLGVFLLLAVSGQVGEFDGQGDIGTSAQPGSARYEAASGVYTVTGGGSNMWFTSDAFHMVWKKVSGDVALGTSVKFEAEGGNPHRKAGVIIRQGLEPDAPYVDLVVHGEGLTSMQFRAAPGGNTEEVRSPVSAPSSIRLERHGDTFDMLVAGAGEPLKKVGSTSVTLKDPVYVGLAVCSHEAERMETALFSQVKIESK